MAKKTTAANVNAVSAADLLNELSDLVPAAEKPKPGGKQRWEITVTGRDAEILSRWVEAKMVSDVVDTRLDNTKDDLCDKALEVVAQHFWKTKARPQNPTFLNKRPDGSTDKAVYLFTDKFKYRFPDVPDGVKARDHFVSVFVGLGLEQDDAEKLVDNELDFNPVVGLRPLTELTQGHYGEKRQFIEATPEEREAGKKIMLFLTGKPDEDGNVTIPALTTQERAMVIRRETGIKVKKDFYGRVCSYCHSVEQLKAVFKVIIPIAYPTYQKLGIGASPEVRAKRLIESAADIIGVSVVDEKDDE